MSIVLAKDNAWGAHQPLYFTTLLIHSKDVAMVKVLFTRYLKSDSRIIRFSKELKLSAIPFIGADFSMHDGQYAIERVIFHDLVDSNDEEWIEAILEGENHSDGTEWIFPDSEIEETVEDMKKNGWILQSNVKRKDIY